MTHTSAVAGTGHSGTRDTPVKTYNEPLRALGWTIALVLGIAFAVIGAVALVVLGGAFVVSLAGALIGIPVTLVVACVLVAIGIWLANGKKLP